MTVRERNILLPMAPIEAFCRRHPIAKLSLFGSVLRDDFTAQSDVDFLVEFLPGHTPGLIKLMQMLLELEKILGREVDLRTPEDLHQRFRSRVLNDAESLYVRND